MSVIIENFPLFREAFMLTLMLTFASLALALAGGTALALLRVSPSGAIGRIAGGYVEVTRNLPTVLLFYWIVFVLPQVGVSSSYFNLALVTLSLYYSAFFCEVIRSGINSVGLGQVEAARSIGLTFSQSISAIVLPQAIRSIIPPLINTFIALVRTTAVAGAFGVPELFSKMQYLANNNGHAVILILLTTAVLYLMITIPAGILSGRLERKAAFSR